ncbi:MAG TPA: hypothetical protein DCM87_05150 [Planctomycetes bacterium]|nr:hypothetical protein [Planctomycetota bacterium]
MPRPSMLAQKRTALLPVVARAFSELGYRRATTATLARRCGVRENILYRLWPDKKAMFIAAIGHVHDLALRVWREQGTRPGGAFSPAAVLAYESEHLGEFGNHRILFAGFSETDDPDIRAALRRLYRDFHEFIRRRLRAGGRRAIDPALAAWAIIGLGTMATMGREMRLMAPRARKRLLKDIGGRLAGVRTP